MSLKYKPSSKPLHTFCKVFPPAPEWLMDGLVAFISEEDQIDAI
jgi:hypothetical protein